MGGLLALAAALGFVSVAAGAFAAHGMSDPRAQELLRTGSLYGFVHVLATFACALLLQMGAERARLAPPFFLAGVVIFSGSLYALAFGAPRWTGAITPIGGLAFLVGWAIVAWAALGLPQR
ncbi:MAG: DUF423 domain-containing protein [Alphaproteobacteria bacterium]|nr:DUF423 domain-containing protein [Alphaproteobacteria bacterium]